MKNPLIPTVEILPPEKGGETLLQVGSTALVRHNPKFDGGPSTGGVGTGNKICGCCFVRKGLKREEVEHSTDCLINVPPEHQKRWRQGRDDLLALYEEDRPPIDEGKDVYYQMGRECTARNLEEILRRRDEGYFVLISDTR